MTDLVGEPRAAQQVGLGLVRHDADGAPGSGVAGSGEAERAGLAGAADDGDDGACS